MYSTRVKLIRLELLQNLQQFKEYLVKGFAMDDERLKQAGDDDSVELFSGQAIVATLSQPLS